MKKIYSTFTLIILTSLLSAQNQLIKQWDKRYGGTVDDVLLVLEHAMDGGYILGGFTDSGLGGDKTQPSWGSSDYWVVKVDSMGIKLWDKRYGGTNLDAFHSLEQTTDGGYIVGGETMSDSSGDISQNNWGLAGSSDYWIIKIDSLGIKQWDKRLGGTQDDGMMSLHQTTDGGYIFGGVSSSDSSGDKTQNCWGAFDYWMVKTDSVGNKQWDKRFGGTDDDLLFDIKQTSDGGYILGGYTESDSSGDKTQPLWGGRDYWIVKTDSVGNKQWDKRFGGTGHDYLSVVQQTNDGGYILGGVSLSQVSGDKTQPTWGGAGDFDLWIVKMDSLGNKQWDRDFGGIGSEDEFSTLTQTPDGDYLIGAASYSDISGDKTENNMGVEQSWILKIDSLGNKQWDKTIFTWGHDEHGYTIKVNDRCYTVANMSNAIVGGYKTQPAWNSSYDYWIVKLCDTTGTSGIAQTLFEEGIVISPNPANEYVEISGKLNAEDEIRLTDVSGRTLFTKTVTTATSSLQLATGSLSRGIYFVEIITNGAKTVKKIVKQ